MQSSWWWVLEEEHSSCKHSNQSSRKSFWATSDLEVTVSCAGTPEQIRINMSQMSHNFVDWVINTQLTNLHSLRGESRVHCPELTWYWFISNFYQPSFYPIIILSYHYHHLIRHHLTLSRWDAIASSIKSTVTVSSGHELKNFVCKFP